MSDTHTQHRSKRTREKVGQEEENETKRTRRKSPTDDAEMQDAANEQEGRIDITSGHGQGKEGNDSTTRPRWKGHQTAQDYIDFASNLVFHSTSELGPYGYDPAKRQYPLETLTALGYLQSPVRRPTIIERWSPYEIALFEAAITHYGKNFYQVQKVVSSKSTKEVIDFYYIWKKTSHYDKWKESYVPPHLDVSDDEGETSKKETQR